MKAVWPTIRSAGRESSRSKAGLTSTRRMSTGSPRSSTTSLADGAGVDHVLEERPGVGLALDQRLLGPPALGHVDDHPDHPGEVAPPVRHAPPPELDPPDLARGDDDPELEVERLAGREGRPPSGLDLLAVVGVDEPLPVRVGRHRLRVQPVALDEPRRDGHPVRGRVPVPDPDPGALLRQPQPLLALAQGLPGPHPLGDVLPEDEGAGDRAAFADRGGRRQDLEGPAVWEGGDERDVDELLARERPRGPPARGPGADAPSGERTSKMPASSAAERPASGRPARASAMSFAATIRPSVSYRTAGCRMASSGTDGGGMANRPVADLLLRSPYPRDDNPWHSPSPVSGRHSSLSRRRPGVRTVVRRGSVPTVLPGRPSLSILLLSYHRIGMYPNRVISMKPLIILAVAAVVAIGIACGIFVVLSSLLPGTTPAGRSAAPSLCPDPRL